jgi:polyhydroxyalkanoate synthase
MTPFQYDPKQLVEELVEFNQNLSKGMKNLLESEEISEGVTPRQEVYSEDKLRLFRYQGSPSVVQNKVPTLIVYALVNRPYMMDIQENRSTIRGLLDAGQDVYLIDWGYPDRSDKYLTLDDYINGYIDRCVDVIRERHGVEKINILGICQGGVFSLCYSTLHQDKVKNLVTMVTPVDCKTPDNMLSHWVQQMDIDLLVDTMGNLPGEMLNWTFLNLKPFQLMGQKYVSMVDIISEEKNVKNFMRMEKWIFDSPDQAGEAFRQFIKDFYQQNKLVEGGLMIGNQEVDLAKLKLPILNIFAEQDHLVPPDASRVMKKLVGSKDYTELSFPGGHIGIYVSGKAQKTVTPAIAEWLNAHC